MTWFLLVVVAALSLWCLLLWRVVDKCLDHIIALYEKVKGLQAGRGTLTALCCDLERQVHVLSNRIDMLQQQVAVFTDYEPEQPFEPDTDMEG